ncbi:hypothetical protein RYH73_09655 [Olivibacter sp. CPCC 100613]|uniref:hypothetical protein n=1 Tax=Olivibacter sp. CPCC 100613 TaxID=3079931 RepID=UPI002FFCCBA1
MIFIYTFIDKQLAQKSLRKALKNSQVEEPLQLTVTQRYISWLGPWFPAGPKTNRLYTAQGREIPKVDWSDAIKTEAKTLKENVPFQIGFFRNTIIFLTAIAILSIIMPKINAKKSAETTAAKEALYKRLAQIKTGDILRVSFINTVDEQSMNGIGLIKVMKIEGDSIFIARSKTVVEDNMDNMRNELQLADFGDAKERVIKHLIEQNPREKVLLAYPKEEEQSNYTVGIAIKFEN